MARICDERLYTICGTPAYMAPEFFQSKRGYSGLPVDVWAVGAIVYEILHNRVAFTATNMRELVSRIKRCVHNPFRHNLPVTYKRFIKRCLEIDVKMRYTIKNLPIPIMKITDPKKIS